LWLQHYNILKRKTLNKTFMWCPSIYDPTVVTDSFSRGQETGLDRFFVGDDTKAE